MTRFASRLMGLNDSINDLAEDIQKYFADWCGMLTDPDARFAGRFGCVLLGRNKNRWDELYDTEWQTRISEHCVGGLGKEDALRFLESAATYHKERGDPTTADNLRKHADAILAVTREQRSQENIRPSTLITSTSPMALLRARTSLPTR